MGKRIIQQARGKGGPRYTAPSFNYKGEAKHRAMHDGVSIDGKITALVHCPGHSAPLARITFSDATEGLIIAPEGIRVGGTISVGKGIEIKPGNTLALHEIPEGTLIYNIEKQPGDGGKFCRSAGTFARVLAKLPSGVVIQMPSKKQKVFNAACRAHVGMTAGGGRLEKPFLKAGKKHWAKKARNKLYPIVSGQSMNAVDHPHGGTTSSHKNYAYVVPRTAPPGAKVGKVAARRTGRTKR